MTFLILAGNMRTSTPPAPADTGGEWAREEMGWVQGVGC